MTVSRDEFDRLDKQVNGNGQPGLKQVLEFCVSQLDAIRGAQDARAKVDERRWTWIKRGCMIVGALAATAPGFVKVLETLHVIPK